MSEPGLKPVDMSHSFPRGDLSPYLQQRRGAQRTPSSQTLPRNSSCKVYSLPCSLLPCLTQLFSLLPCLTQPPLSLPVATLSTPGSQTLPRNSSCEVYSLTRSLPPCLNQLFSLSPSLPHPALLSLSLLPCLTQLFSLLPCLSLSLLPCLTQPPLSFPASPSSSLSPSLHHPAPSLSLLPCLTQPPLSHSFPASPSPLALSPCSHIVHLSDALYGSPRLQCL